MKIGPLTQTDFTSIKGLLDEAGHQYEVFIDELVKADPRQAVPPRNEIHAYPTYYGSLAYITLEVPSPAAVLLIKPQLEKMGISVLERDFEVDESPEESDEWIDLRRKRSRSQARIVTLVILLLLGAVYIGRYVFHAR